ncbi:PASTA domain-containing protein [Prosthecochloris sp.]|uniref:PASTA domain-containing protein n=1 Tax=Prosthecochloris sp. TaxID=290513 RepID=UPI002600656C|nr:PASTA domain-containing protein [Prosthecochloris sp.]
MKKVLVVVVLLVAGYVVMDKFVMISYTRQGQSVLVPNVEKMSYDNALGVLRAAGLAGKKSYNVRYLREVDSNTVIVQRPVAGAEVKPGRTVYLVLNKREKPRFSIPDFYGRPLDEVRQILDRFDITVTGVQVQSVYDPAEDGRVLSQSVAPKTVVSSGSSISLIVGKAEVIETVQKIPVPDVLGMSLKQARSVIVENGFNTGNVSYEYSSLLVPYTVINQKPAVNALAEPGKVVDLTVVVDDE